MGIWFFYGIKIWWNSKFRGLKLMIKFIISESQYNKP